MSDQKISVIVAVYNIEKYLPKCIESILAQTHRNLQIILVDDGATDTSPAICDAYAEKDPRIQVIHKPNGGLSDARNAGLAVAEGEYIGYVDGDDWIEPGMYESMVNACETQEAQVAVCRYKKVYRDRVEDGSSGDVVPLTREEAFEIYIQEHPQYIIYNSVWSKLFRRDLVQDIRFPVGKNSEDILYTTKAFCRMQKCVYLDTGFYNYVIDREGSIMNEKSGKRSIEDEIPFLRQQIEMIAAAGLETEAKWAAYMFYKRLLFYFLVFFQTKRNRVYAREIVRQVRQDKGAVDKLYQETFVKKGDKVRMSLFRTAPVFYYGTVKLYDSLVLPLRRRLRKG